MIDVKIAIMKFVFEKETSFLYKIKVKLSPKNMRAKKGNAQKLVSFNGKKTLASKFG